MGLYGGLVAVVRCSFDQVGRGPGPPHHQLVDYSRVHDVHGQHSLDELERPELGRSEPAAPRPWADPPRRPAAPRGRASARGPAAGDRAPRRSRPDEPPASPRWSRIITSLDGIAARRQTYAHDALGLDAGLPRRAARSPAWRPGTRSVPAGRPLVVVAGMLEQAAQVTLASQQVQPDVVRVADDLGITRRHRVLPTDVAVEVGLLEVGLHQQHGAVPMGPADGRRRPRAVCRGHGVLDEPTGLLSPPVPPQACRQAGPGLRRARRCPDRHWTAPRLVVRPR